jgi:KipI family sensor histidine kinase inhibitor
LSLNTIKIEFKEILKSFSNEKIEVNKFRLYEIPVCYEEFGEDLESLSKHSGLKIEEIIEIHSEQIYTLYFIGFMPGFLYMGNVDERIVMPRLKNPRPKVEKGSIGIAENQTGIYPNTSPGGWQIIGRTPIDIFNVDKEPPSIFKPGDQIKFKPIDEKAFNAILNQTNAELKYYD